MNMIKIEVVYEPGGGGGLHIFFWGTIRLSD